MIIILPFFLFQACETKPSTNKVHAQTKRHVSRSQTPLRSIKDVSLPCPAILSVDGELDVGLLLVLHERRHPHGFVPTAQHALFDAGRVDLTDEALQRLQAAAKHCSVAQARTRQPTTEVLVCAVGLGMRRGRGKRKRRVKLCLVMLWVVVVVKMGMGETHISRPGCTCTRCQHLIGITVTVRGSHDAVPQRSEVLSDRHLPLYAGADSLLPDAHSARMRPIRQL